MAVGCTQVFTWTYLLFIKSITQLTVDNIFAESSVIIRLLKARKVDGSKSEKKSRNVERDSSHEPVLLFTRFDKECYCCLGRLEWVAVDVESHPVKFKWELMDFDKYYHTPHFQRILHEC